MPVGQGRTAVELQDVKVISRTTVPVNNYNNKQQQNIATAQNQLQENYVSDWFAPLAALYNKYRT